MAVLVNNVLEFQNVSKTYAAKGTDPVLAVNEVSFAIPDEEAGEFIALIGPSGSGKSTMLNMISGILSPTSGQVLHNGVPITGVSRSTVTVQQAYTCFPWLTVRQNVAFGLELERLSSAEIRQISDEYLTKVGLQDRADAFPRELSGGMQQRVAIARALALKRPILLMDEPFGALDAQTRASMQQTLVDLWQKEKSLVIFVTHDINEAILLADRIIVLSARPAHVVYDVKVPFERPRTPHIIGDLRFIQLAETLLDYLKSPGAGKVAPGT